MLHAHARLARTRWLRPLLDLADLTDIEWRCADGEGEGSGTTLTQTDNNGRRGGGGGLHLLSNNHNHNCIQNHIHNHRSQCLMVYGSANAR